jgi:hypothetical protein
MDRRNGLRDTVARTSRPSPSFVRIVLTETLYAHGKMRCAGPVALTTMAESNHQKMDNENKELSIAIAAIFKNELPFIIEWIAYHRAVGVKRFFIADNDSNDGTRDLLGALASTGLIDLIDFPNSPNGSTQMNAYRVLMQRYGSSVDWIAFIDADEFMMPQGGCRNVPDLLNAIEAYNHIGAIALNWAIYGSGGYAGPIPGLVTERFQLRAQKDFETNLHYKSIVRTSAFRDAGTNPHYFLLKEGYQSVHSNGHRVDNPVVPGISAKVVWSNLRLNHYVVKSRREFFEKKMSRGSIGNPNGPNWAYFRHHDRNEEIDLMRQDLLAGTFREIEVIRQLLGFRVPV